jgi:cytochrome c
MDSFEFNKIAGGVLSALLFIFGVPELYAMVQGHGGHATNMGFELPMPKDTGGAAAGGAPAADAFSFAKVAAALPNASADSGKDVFKACTQCHTGEKGGANKLGPNLFGIVGRDIGKHAGFTYSPAVAEKGGQWTWEHLVEYLHNPKEYIPGNRMSYAGVKDVAEMADLLAYLRTLSDSPVALPAVPAAAPAAEAEKK